MLDEHPFFAPQTRWVLANCGRIDPSNMDEYIAYGGYRSLVDVLTRMTPEQVCDAVDSQRAARTRRRRIPDRQEVEIRAGQRERPEVPDLQCGRRGSRRVHGPSRHRRGSAPAGRRHGDRRLRDRSQQGLRLHSGRISAGHPPPHARRWNRPKQAGLLGDNILGTGFDLHITDQDGGRCVRVWRGNGADPQH